MNEPSNANDLSLNYQKEKKGSFQYAILKAKFWYQTFEKVFSSTGNCQDAVIHLSNQFLLMTKSLNLLDIDFIGE